MGNVNFEITLPVGPRWGNVELLRSAILNCVAALFRDADLSHSVSTVTGELLENAVKYGDWSDTTSQTLGLSVRGDDHAVHIEVSNPVDPGGEHVAGLESTVARLRGFASPREAYLACMQRVAEGDGESSQLGLARIAYEGNASLGVVRNDTTVRVTATCARNAVQK